MYKKFIEANVVHGPVQTIVAPMRVDANPCCADDEVNCEWAEYIEVPASSLNSSFCEYQQMQMETAKGPDIDLVVVDNDGTAPLISEGNGLVQGADAVIGDKIQCDPGPGDDGWSAHFAYLDAARGRRSEGVPMQSTVAVVVDDMVPEIVQEGLSVREATVAVPVGALFLLKDKIALPIDFQDCVATPTEQLIIDELQAHDARYVSMHTNGNGACGIHAPFGVLVGGELMCEDGRQLAANALRTYKRGSPVGFYAMVYSPPSGLNWHDLLRSRQSKAACHRARSVDVSGRRRHSCCKRLP